MFEGLVKQLRYCATHDCHHEGEELVGCTAPYNDEYEGITTCNDVLQMKAADAIEEMQRCIDGIEADNDSLCVKLEELSAVAESYKRSIETWADEAARAHDMMPRWIPVTERLPQPYEDVNLQFSTNQAVGFWDGYCWGVYSGDGFYTEVADNEGKPTHWCKKLPEPPKEEDNG